MRAAEREGVGAMLLHRCVKVKRGRASSCWREEPQHHPCCLPHQPHHPTAPWGFRLGGLCDRDTSVGPAQAMGTWANPVPGSIDPPGKISWWDKVTQIPDPQQTPPDPTCAKENNPSILILAKTNTRKTGEGLSQPIWER